jgi:hypothetical protein
MERMELSFKNSRVRMWFLVMVPAIFITILLFITLPNNYHFIPTATPIVAMVVYWVWDGLEKYKSKKAT